MKSQKAQKNGRPGPGLASQGAKIVAAQAADSDEDFDDFLPAPAVATGSNAYELLLGGLDRFYEAPLSNIRSKPPKVKTRHPSTAGAPQERAADSTPAEQPLHDSNDASSSDDGADDRSGGATEEAADTAEVADQGVADFFSNHLDTSSGPADYEKASSTWTEASHSGSDWPGTTWLTTGLSFPRVCQHLCLLCACTCWQQLSPQASLSWQWLSSQPSCKVQRLLLCILLRSHSCIVHTSILVKQLVKIAVPLQTA